MSDDLIAFISARLDEDEAVAKAAHPGPWVLEEEAGAFGPAAWISVPFGHGMPNAKSGLTRFAPLGTQDAATAEHIARHDPARVLREVEAKRVIVARYEFARKQVAVGAVNEAAGYGPADTGWPLRADSHELDVRSIASVYSGHPDYRAEWKP